LRLLHKQTSASQGFSTPLVFTQSGQEHLCVNWEKYSYLGFLTRSKSKVVYRDSTQIDVTQMKQEEELIKFLEHQLHNQEEAFERRHHDTLMETSYDEENRIESEEEKDYHLKKHGLTHRIMALYAEFLLLRDISWVFFAFVVICFAEGRKLSDGSDDPQSSIFKVIFEIVSAYGTVGFSLGYPDTPYSYSGTWTTLSKLVIIVIMFLGRHRGLPSSDDPAVIPNNYQSLRAFRSRRRLLIEKLKQKRVGDKLLIFDNKETKPQNFQLKSIVKKKTPRTNNIPTNTSTSNLSNGGNDKRPYSPLENENSIALASLDVYGTFEDQNHT